MVKWISIFLMLVSVATPKTVHVATDGSNTSPYDTEAKGSTSIQTAVSTLTAGDTCIIHTGTYYEYVTLPSACVGTLGNVITIRADTGDTVTVTGTAAITGWTPCDSDEAGLTVGGSTNANYASIYRSTVTLSSAITTTLVQLFENNTHCRISRDPDAILGYGNNTDLYHALDVLPAEGLRTTTLIDSHRTQANDYWNGAYLDIWTHGANNVVVRRTVSDFDAATDTFTFTPALTADLTLTGGTNPDAYSVVNHPMILDSAGEYYINPTPVSETTYTVYLWPTTPGDPDTSGAVITYPYRVRAFRATTTAKNYITIKDIIMYGQTGECISWEAASTGLTVDGCTMNDAGDDGIQITSQTTCTITGCTIKRNTGFGVYAAGGTGVTVKDSTIGDNVRTNIYYVGTTSSSITGNTIETSSGVHGNGVAAYTGCDKLLVAKNFFNNCNFASNTLSNLVFFANVCDSYDTGGGGVTQWSVATTPGYQVFINNTLYGSPVHNSLSLKSKTASPWVQFYIVNNIIDGMTGSITPDFYLPAGAWHTNQVSKFSNNLWVAYCSSQSATYHWDDHMSGIPSEVYLPGLSPAKTVNDVWTDYVNNAYTLKASSPADGIGFDYINGADPNLTSIGVMTDWPSYDFTTDIAGNAWASPPAAGAYEAGGFQFTNTDTARSVTEDAAMTSVDYNVSGNTGTVVFSLDAAALALGATINSSTGVVAWTPNLVPGATADVDYTWTITATDDGPTPDVAITKELAVHYDYQPPLTNSAPEITGVENREESMGVNVNIPAVAVDVDSGDTLTWTVTGLPSTLSISSSTGLISGTPTAPGRYSVTRTVSDGTATDSESFELLIVTKSVSERSIL